MIRPIRQPELRARQKEFSPRPFKLEKYTAKVGASFVRNDGY